ncbi:iron transporter [Pseudonocardiaceae bacterium YIM PH 21723]|nr:iron transporter [Pseudonocardiaceae bacterium YIM PH 21723]
MLVSNGLIGLREGLEAALVVSILVAFLVKTDRRHALRYVWLGVTTAVLLSVAFAAVLTYTVASMSFEDQETFGGTASIIAVLFVTGMIFWMRKAARTISAQLRGKLSEALEIGPLAVALVAFLAVGREGLETAIFFFTSVERAGTTAQPLLGFLIGIAIAVALAYGIYRGAMQIDLSKFFKVTGVLLIFVAAGVLAYGIHDLQEGGVLPGLNSLAFDVGAYISVDSWYGALLKGFFNFSPQTTWLQAVAWVLYVGIVLTLFLRASAPARTKETQA